MREIKFRVWDTVYKNMIYPEGNDDCKIYLNGSISYGGAWCTSEMILIQYTGLKDRNGKEIFESDILTVSGLRGNKLPHGVIYFDEGRYMINLKHEFMSSDSSYPLQWDIAFLNDYQCTLQIIGNKFENPELLNTNR